MADLKSNTAVNGDLTISGTFDLNGKIGCSSLLAESLALQPSATGTSITIPSNTAGTYLILEGPSGTSGGAFDPITLRVGSSGYTITCQPPIIAIVSQLSSSGGYYFIKIRAGANASAASTNYNSISKQFVLTTSSLTAYCSYRSLKLISLHLNA